MENSGKIERSAGILMHISSLPSPFGIGTFGKTAYEFVDFVAQARHRYWQVLPLGPTTYGDSPYQSYSAFAGNPYFVDLERLTDDGILDRNIYEDIDWGSGDYVDYEKVYNNRFTVLHEAYKNYRQKLSESRVKLAAGLPEYKKFDNFNKTNAYWLDDYALFMALKWHFNQKSWQDWDEDIKFRTQKGMQKYKELLADEIGFWKFVQYEFDKQWKKLKEYANENNVDIIGDIPIYMGLDSSDVWADAGEFLLDENLTPVKVAGVPPDAFSELGQKWGNPLYDWNKMEANGFRWWRARMAHSAELYDVIRIDHFIGIVKYYTIPADMPDARQGSYEQGPGQKLLDVINEAIGDKKIIAEDLGVSLPEVDVILRENNYPSMKVLEFAFGGDRKNPHLPYNYSDNCVVYGGTHDNETLMGYFTGHNEWELGYAFDYLDTRDRARMVDNVFRAAYSSVACLAIFTVQDILKLGNEARMNMPSSFGNNWKWRMRAGSLNNDRLNEMRYLASVFGRES